MVGSERLLSDSQRTFEEWLRFFVPALRLVEQPRQVVEAGGGTGMAQPESFLIDRQCALIRADVRVLRSLKNALRAGSDENRLPN